MYPSAPANTAASYRATIVRPTTRLEKERELNVEREVLQVGVELVRAHKNAPDPQNSIGKRIASEGF